MLFPRDFPKWDKTVDGLQDVGSWLLELERSRLPANLVLPRAGQLWETLRDCEVSFHAQIDLPQPRLIQALLDSKGPGKSKPFDWEPYLMQFGAAALHCGERVRILEILEPKPISVRFVPIRYQELQESIVPERVRSRPTYHGIYELSAKIARTISDFQKTARHAYFNEDFRLVKDVA
jgi:hypothetical protein